VESLEVLENDRDLATQLFGIYSGQIDAVPTDIAGIGLVQAGEELCQGGLARAVLADEGDHLARRDIERNSSKRRLTAGRVREHHVADTELVEARGHSYHWSRLLQLGQHTRESQVVLQIAGRFGQGADGVGRTGKLPTDDGDAGHGDPGGGDPHGPGQREPGHQDQGGREHGTDEDVRRQRHPDLASGHPAQLPDPGLVELVVPST
jgi:hypothetical protein